MADQTPEQRAAWDNLLAYCRETHGGPLSQLDRVTILAVDAELTALRAQLARLAEKAAAHHGPVREKFLRPHCNLCEALADQSIQDALAWLDSQRKAARADAIAEHDALTAGLLTQIAGNLSLVVYLAPGRKTTDAIKWLVDNAKAAERERIRALLDSVSEAAATRTPEDGR